MSFHVRCDWCGAGLYKDDQAVMSVKIERKSELRTMERRWAEEVRPTLHYCVAGSVDYNRMGLPGGGEELDSCYERAIAAIQGTATTPPDMGMEWRLMPIDGEGAGSVEPAIGLEARPDADIANLEIGVRAHNALRKAGIESIHELAALTASQLAEIEGVGPTMAEQIKEGLRRWDASFPPGRKEAH